MTDSTMPPPVLIACLFPDCERTFSSGTLETDKRLVVNHINDEHDTAHAIIACAHSIPTSERIETKTTSADGEQVTVTHLRGQCERCGDILVADVSAPPAVGAPTPADNHDSQTITAVDVGDLGAILAD